MVLKVREDDLESYGRMIDRAGQDAVEAKRYLDSHGQITTESQGMFTRPFDFHSTLKSNVTSVFERLSTILDASATELQRSATYYRNTDRGAAAEIDATLPKSER